jgi:dihydrodipicolinate synthase/N-acetylneuraminate lyase
MLKYRKNEAKDYGKTALKGVWTALSYHFTADDKLDEKAIARSLDYSISELKIEGHYCSGNVAEFWSLTNEERMRAHEINVEANKGRVPLIAGCHHQNPYEVVKLAQHAEAIGIDFVIILTPYQGAKNDDAVYDFYRFICERVNIGIVLFNIPTVYYPISEHLAARLAKLPNIAGFKQGGGAPGAMIGMRKAIGKELSFSCSTTAPTCTRSQAIPQSTTTPRQPAPATTRRPSRSAPRSPRCVKRTTSGSARMASRKAACPQPN